MEKRYEMTADRPMELYDFLRFSMGLTKKQISQLKFREQGILVDGVQRRVTYKLSPGECVSVHLEKGNENSGHLRLNDTPLTVLYEDEDICIVNKPAGVSTHPAGMHYEDTVANMLMYYFYEKGESLRIRPVGRLDLETSGALMFAKNRAAAGRLAGQRKSGILKKEYIAVVCGELSEDGTIDAPLAKDPENPLRMVWADPGCEEGKPAVTHYRVLERYADSTVIAVTIDTGRMHQIRCHMAGIGHPLVGDTVYGSASERIGRTALHAAKLTFRQPFTKETMTVEAELPEDMRGLCGN